MNIDSRVDTDPRISTLVSLIREGYQPDSPTHDLSHLSRVAALGSRLADEEGADKLIVTSAAWLHDLHRDRKAMTMSFFASPEDFDERARDFLSKAEIPDSSHESILNAIHYTDRYSFSDRFPTAASPEARCVRDADNLDATGAIGVARAFCFGGSHDIPIWEPAAPLRNGMYDHSNRPSSTIHHFHEKLMRLGGEFETSAATRLAERRGAYLEEFAEQLMKEWSEDFGQISNQE
jgi:uncharacterized protein